MAEAKWLRVSLSVDGELAEAVAEQQRALHLDHRLRRAEGQSKADQGLG